MRLGSKVCYYIDRLFKNNGTEGEKKEGEREWQEENMWIQVKSFYAPTLRSKVEEV